MRKKSLLMALVLGSAVTALGRCPDPEPGTPDLPLDMTAPKVFHVMGMVVGTSDMPLVNANV